MPVRDLSCKPQDPAWLLSSLEEFVQDAAKRGNLWQAWETREHLRGCGAGSRGRPPGMLRLLTRIPLSPRGLPAAEASDWVSPVTCYQKAGKVQGLLAARDTPTANEVDSKGTGKVCKAAA